NEDQPMPVDRPGHHGVAVVADPPDLPAGARLVAGHQVTAGADYLLPPLDRDQQRRAEGEQVVGLAAVARRLPEHAAGPGLEGDDELPVLAVAVEDEGVPGQHGRAAGAVPGVVTQAGVLPHDSTVQPQAGGPVVAEVDVEPRPVGERAGAGVAVLAVDGS